MSEDDRGLEVAYSCIIFLNWYKEQPAKPRSDSWNPTPYPERVGLWRIPLWEL